MWSDALKILGKIDREVSTFQQCNREMYHTEGGAMDSAQVRRKAGADGQRSPAVASLGGGRKYLMEARVLFVSTDHLKCGLFDNSSAPSADV